VSQEISLREAERKAFASTFQHGLWDIFIGCFLLQFVIGPFLSRSLGDFWSSAVFVPFLALTFVALWLVKRYVVAPRVGSVRFGAWRKARLRKFNIVALAVCLAALALGLLSAVDFAVVPGWMIAARFGLVFLLLFSIAAYSLDFTRLYAYGLLTAVSPLVGEWLWVSVGVPHHGYPVAFGISAAIAMCVGVVKFVRLLRTYPVPAESPSAEAFGG
jgi:hypothetical protein